MATYTGTGQGKRGVGGLIWIAVVAFLFSAALVIALAAHGPRTSTTPAPVRPITVGTPAAERPTVHASLAQALGLGLGKDAELPGWYSDERERLRISFEGIEAGASRGRTAPAALALTLVRAPEAIQRLSRLPGIVPRNRRQAARRERLLGRCGRLSVAACPTWLARIR